VGEREAGGGGHLVSPIAREYFRIPRDDRAVYLRPSLSELPALVESNRRLIASHDFELAGCPFAEFRAAARQEIVSLARAWTQERGFTAPDWSEPAPLVFTGHQPQPFHPGVWFKNFLAGGLAAQAGGVCVNMAVDNDEPHGQVLRFPVRTAGAGGGETVRVGEFPLVPNPGGVPFEEQPASDADWRVPESVQHDVPPECAEPFQRLWSYVREAACAAETVGEACTLARRRLEEELGLANLEIPISAIADSEAFRLFLAEMVARREDLFAAYNESLAEYRRVYHERSAAQPVPDLVRDDERVELPFWAWRAGEVRRRLWAGQAEAGAVALLADRRPIGTLDASELADVTAAAARLAAFRETGCKIRPRALSLTLFTHLCLGDVFVHGLGGALYDKVTDVVFERFLGVRAPGVILATCTVHLPLEAYPSTRADLETARRGVRDWRFNPDRMMSGAVREGSEAQALMEEKWRLIRDLAPTRDGRSRAYHRVHAVNAALAGLEPQGPAAAEMNLDRVERELRRNAILQNREYPFWFYPAADLAAFYRKATAL